MFVTFGLSSLLQLVATYGETCADIMPGAFGVETPHQWQKEAFSHQFHMKRESLVNGQPCYPSILCVPTSGGKSLLRDTCAVSTGGVTLCISPLLSLSRADQITKDLHKRTNRSFIPIQLDDFKTVVKIKRVIKDEEQRKREQSVSAF